VASGSANASPGERNDILAALIREVEANKRYPRNARRAGIEGRVALRVVISPDGRVSGCTLARVCGKSVLDDAARELGETLVGLDIPAARGRSMTVTIPVQYSLTR
jgi:protein TonB